VARLQYTDASGAYYADEVKDYASEHEMRIIRSHFADEMSGRKVVSSYALAADPAGEYYIVASDGDFYSSETYPLYTNDLAVAADCFANQLLDIVG
jgi:hypothetical protein